MKKIELLAPVGDREGLEVAINNGADAVYLGLPQFNARIKATNFTVDNIADVVTYAHLRGVKVYLTVNTIIKNKEITDFIALIKCAISAKIDAYIIQDLGVYYILTTYFKGLILHASTQMGIHNLYGAEVAQKMGFTRVVLARETKLADIAEISAHTKLELEYFVQGALCVGFSGNCYLSSYLTKNSGNRGKCAQMCRLNYSAEIAAHKLADGYLLSTRDLCLINNLKALSEAGVTSAKIEGRMRRTAYVAESVSCYRRAIDKIGANYNTLDAIARLKSVFNRGEYNYNAYLADGTPSRIINAENQNHIGLPIGKVINVEPFKDIYKITIESNKELHCGDGIKFFDAKKECGSIGIGNINCVAKNTYVVYSKNKIPQNASCSIIFDKAKEDNHISQSGIPNLYVDITATAYANCPLTLIANHKGVEVKYKSDYILPLADGVATNKDEIEGQLLKLGGTGFVAGNITIKMDNVFIPKSILNAARREVIDKLTNAVINKNSKVATKIYMDNAACAVEALPFLCAEKAKPCNKENFYVIGSVAQLAIAQTHISATDILVIKPFIYNINNISALYGECKKIVDGGNIALELPNIAAGEDIAILDNILSVVGIKTLVINNLYGFAYAERGYKIIVGSQLNIFNNYAKEVAKTLSASKIVVSIEQNLVNYDYDESDCIYSYGRFALMTLAHCPYKENYNNSCKSCTYKSGLKYKLNNHSYAVQRKIIKNCYFELLIDTPINNCQHSYNQYLDFTNVSAAELGEFFDKTAPENAGLFAQEIE